MKPGRDGRDWPGINARPAGRCRDGPADRPRRGRAGLVRRYVGAPYDLLAAFLSVREDRLRAILARWRKAGYADTGRLGPGPGWCWLTRLGRRRLDEGPSPKERRPAAARDRLHALLASATTMQQGDISYTLTFEPAATGTRMRWSGQVRPKGAFRLLGPVITWMGTRQEHRIWTSLKKHLEAAPAARPETDGNRWQQQLRRDHGIPGAEPGMPAGRPGPRVAGGGGRY